MSHYLILFAGIIAAAIGGELFVRGAVGMVKWIRIPAGIIGATVAAFAISSPELAVSINASFDDRPQIALGDALGSNVVSIALILGIALVISGIKSLRDSIKRDFPVAIVAPFLTAILVLDGEISRIDGAVMLTVFLAWLVAVVLEARRQRSLAEDILGEKRRGSLLVSIIFGLGALILAGRFIVLGAKGSALSFGLDEFVIGATVVAIGTSAPELATTVISKLRGHDEVDTIPGSNIFNNFWIVSWAALVTPITPLPIREVVIEPGFGAISAALTFPAGNGLRRPQPRNRSFSRLPGLCSDRFAATALEV